VPKSDQEWLEARDQVFDNLDRCIKRFNNRLTFDNLRLIERYVEGELQLLIHFVVAGRGDHEYVAHLRFASSPLRSEKRRTQGDEGNHIRISGFGEQLSQGVPNEDAMMSEVADEDSTVLVHDVKTVENPQQRLPTLARIDLADRFYDLFPEGLYWSEGIGFRRLGVVIDRELDPGFLGRGRGRGDKQKLIGQVIQSGSQSVNDFANQRVSERGDVPQFRDVKAGVSRLRIVMGTDFICAAFCPSPHLDFEITALFVGPFNTSQGESQTVRHDESSILREIKGYLPEAKYCV